eukprot:Blabericola_migrator_1__1711@NODE_145_length_12990_cov_99_814439_g126_i0_p5_GENE_NODE_145_length_12990_cov_99_814439_g126_i0NODE_145_length_12990_cov_99_814439_g126_i0_p5_ORF_typecomplete_len309_score52_75_NODE_145_length_12990_cov_99_814439_g126_i046295555
MTTWNFARVAEDEVRNQPIATLRIRSCVIPNNPLSSPPFWCERCFEESLQKYAYPVMHVPFHFTCSSETVRDCEGLVAAFLDFTFNEIGNYWCPKPLEQSDDSVPLADIVAKVPVSQANRDSSSSDDIQTPRTQQNRMSRAKRRLLRRSVAAMKSQDVKDWMGEREHGIKYENYDIVTDEHLFDVLELLSTCHRDTATLNIIDVSTCLYPTICHRHDDSFKFHLASMKNRSRHFFDATVGRFRRAIDAIKMPGFFHQKWLHFTQALKIPEFKRLIRTGLYTPKYLDNQIDEVWNNLDSSIAKGFEKPF